MTTTVVSSSDPQVDFNDTSDEHVYVAARPFAIAHACLMLIAWVGLASSGTLVARYYKPQWADSKLCGEKVWFAIHRSVMLLVVALNIAALLLILTDLGWTWTGELTHATIGMIVICLTVIQPIMAFFRPHPDGQHRWIFNWAHQFIGTTAHILSAPAIFIGMSFSDLNLPDAVFYIMIAFVVWHISADAILQMNQRFLDNTKTKNGSEVSSYGSVMETMDNVQPPPVYHGHCFRNTVLIVYLIGNVSLLATMVALIAKYF